MKDYKKTDKKTDTKTEDKTSGDVVEFTVADMIYDDDDTDGVFFSGCDF